MVSVIKGGHLGRTPFNSFQDEEENNKKVVNATLPITILLWTIAYYDHYILHQCCLMIIKYRLLLNFATMFGIPKPVNFVFFINLNMF